MIQRNLLPLLVGVVIGTLLVTAYFVVTTGSFFGSPIQRAREAAAVAALYAFPVAAICGGLAAIATWLVGPPRPVRG